MQKNNLYRIKRNAVVISGIILIALLVLVAPMYAHGDVTLQSGSGNPQSGSGAGAGSEGSVGISNPLQNIKSVGALVQVVAQIFSYIVVIVGVIALIWTGLQYILAQGKAEKIKELKKQLMWVVIGIAVVIGARIIISVVINTLSATGAVDSNIINNANSALNGGN